MSAPTHAAKTAAKVARKGGHVIVVGDRHNGLFKQIQQAKQGQGIKAIIRTNGNEHLDYTSGGTIRFIRSARYARGRAADLILAPIGTDAETMADIKPCLTGTSDGQILGYH